MNNNCSVVLNAVEETVNPFNKSHNLCSICGSSKHDNKNCDYIKLTNFVPDKEIPSKARLSLPDCLEIIKQSDGSFNIRTKIVFEKGTEFGPFVANKMFSLNPEIEFALKIFINNSEDFNEYYLDTRDENHCNWMMFISPASDFEEQNLVCYQKQEDIFYATKRNIKEMELLKVWYAPFYAKKMGKALLEPVVIEENFQISGDLNDLIETQQKIKKRDLWICKYCGKVENAVVKFAQHILMHYSNHQSKRCEFCNKLFGSRDNLEKHLKIMHNTTPAASLIKENIAKIQSVAQNSVKVNKSSETDESEIGGPLIVGNAGNLINDALDNNLLASTSLNFDNDVEEALNVDLLDENADFFNLEMSFSADKEEDFVCDICQKSFQKLRNLVQHLHGHTGEFFCSSCNRIFGRLESLRHHSCRKTYSLKCDKCEKIFTQRKNLTAHMKGVHERQFKCDKCQRNYCSKAERDLHNCSNVPLTNKRQFHCDLCGKVFLRLKYLKSHLSRHDKSKNKPSEEQNKLYICELCSKTYHSQKNYRFHLNTHYNPSTFDCNICDKKFSRSDSLKSHLLLHKDLLNMHNCTLCEKSFKTRKSLTNHMKTCHSKSVFRCKDCEATFKTKTSLQRHFRIKHLGREKVQIEGRFKCSQCSKSMQLKSSLTRHLKTAHRAFYDASCDGKKEKLKNFNVELGDKIDFASEEVNSKAQESNNIVINIEDVLDPNTIDNLLNNNGNLLNSTKDVFLSMPDLTESEIDAEMHFPLIHNEDKDLNDKKDEVVIYVVDKK